MSIEGTVRKKGKKILHIPGPSSALGVFDVATGTVVQTPLPQREIFAVLDGFGSLESQLRADEYKTGSSESDGSLRVFAASRLDKGDTVVIDEKSYVLKYVKQVWKGSRVVFWEGVAEL